MYAHPVLSADLPVLPLLISCMVTDCVRTASALCMR
jgi:hypothetical protein